MKALRNLSLILLIFVAATIIFSYTLYTNQIKPVSESEQVVIVEIEEGTSAYDIGKTLEEKELIKSEFFFRVYLKLNEGANLQAGTYELTPSMGIENIVLSLQEGVVIRPDEVTITFKEGINIRELATIISEKTNNKENDVYNTIKDKDYLNSLIEEHWFITEEILDEEIYYSLEGYLFPETYNFEDRDVSVETIFNKMINQLGKELETHKDEIANSEYTVHEFLTLASVVELEGVYEEDRKLIAGVFYNRLAINDGLGSDVTTYYAEGIDMGDRDLTNSELNDSNAYNTRNGNLPGQLPIGPICLPSRESIDAVVNPTDSDYYFFVADKNMKIYFGETNSDHEENIRTIKNNGDWITW
jgi:UPF0755 protein